MTVDFPPTAAPAAAVQTTQAYCRAWPIIGQAVKVCKLLAWVASSLQSRETHVADFACIWDRNFLMKITAKISYEYSDIR